MCESRNKYTKFIGMNILKFQNLYNISKVGCHLRDQTLV